MPDLNFIIPSKSGRDILADFYPCEKKHVAPLVIFCHGYKGFKDWGHFNLFPRHFCMRGFHFLKFNFSHNGGTLDNPIDFPDLEAFSENNYSIELQDLQDVINWICSDKSPYLDRIDVNEIYLIGHSRGGGICILTASNDKRIKKLVTWSSVGDFARRFPSGNTLSEWEKDGVHYVLNSRTKQKMPHKYQFYQNFIENRDKLNIAEAEKSLTIPHLLIHGTADETVYLGEALHLMSLNERVSLIKLHGATHTFGGYHPYKEEVLPQHALSALDYTLTFLTNE